MRRYGMRDDQCGDVAICCLGREAMWYYGRQPAVRQAVLLHRYRTGVCNGAIRRSASGGLKEQHQRFSRC